MQELCGLQRLIVRAGLAGAFTLGRGAMLSGQVAVTDHVSVGAGARIGGQSGVAGDVAAGETLFGTPARPLKRTLREQAALGRLPDLLQPGQTRGRARDKRTMSLAQRQWAGGGPRPLFAPPVDARLPTGSGRRAVGLPILPGRRRRVKPPRPPNPL